MKSLSGSSPELSVFSCVSQKLSPIIGARCAAGRPLRKDDNHASRALDWGIIVLSLLICFVPALFFGKRAGKGTAEFFASGGRCRGGWRDCRWSPRRSAAIRRISCTNIVRQQGVAGNWCWWAFVLTGVSTVFFYAELWRRSGVLTDLEFYEIRYSGKAAGVVRGFRPCTWGSSSTSSSWPA